MKIYKPTSSPRPLTFSQFLKKLRQDPDTSEQFKVTIVIVVMLFLIGLLIFT